LLPLEYPVAIANMRTHIVRTTIAKTLAGAIGFIGALETWMGIQLATDAITDSNSIPAMMAPLFLVTGLGQIAVCALVFLQYCQASVRLLSAVIGFWVWSLGAPVLDRFANFEVDNIAWQNFILFIPVLAGFLVYKCCLRGFAQRVDPMES